jgi:hypothetical protein
MRKSAIVMAGLSLLGLLVFGSCEQQTGRASRSGPAGVRATAGGEETGRPEASLVFCRGISRKTGRPLGVADRFVVGRSRSVSACLDLTGLCVGKTYAIHLIWLGPQNDEIFRKYADVCLDRTESGFDARIEWRQAEDLNYRKSESQKTSEPAIQLTSSLGIGQERDRPLGSYKLCVYLFREKLLVGSFELSDS